MPAESTIGQPYERSVHKEPEVEYPVRLMIDDTDLSSMTPGEAREYVLAFITTLKKTLRDRQRLQEQLELWKRRVSLAGERNESELQKAAETRVREISQQIAILGAEERKLSVQVERLKEELRRVESLGSRTVDAGFLLEQLKTVAGEPDTTSEAIRDLEADAELERLKRKMGKQDT